MLFTSIRLGEIDNVGGKPTIIFLKKSQEILVKNIIKQSVFYKEVNNLILADHHTIKVLKLSGLCKTIKYHFAGGKWLTGLGKHGKHNHHTNRYLLNQSEQESLLLKPSNIPCTLIQGTKTQTVNFWTDKKLINQFSSQVPQGTRVSSDMATTQGTKPQYLDTVHTTSSELYTGILLTEQQENKAFTQKVLLHLNSSIPFKETPASFSVIESQPKLVAEIIQARVIIDGQLCIKIEQGGRVYNVMLPNNHELAQGFLKQNSELIGKSMGSDLLAFQTNPDLFKTSLVNKQLNYSKVIGSGYSLDVIKSLPNHNWFLYLKMIWSNFGSNIAKTPEQFGLTLGEKNYISILDVPFRLQTTTLHNLGAAYIQVLADDTIRIKPITNSDTIGITQCVAILDTMLTLSEEVDLAPPMITEFSVAGHVFYELDERAILLILQHQAIICKLNTKSYNSLNFESHQFCFHRGGDEPAFGEAYIDSCVALQNSLNLGD